MHAPGARALRPPPRGLPTRLAIVLRDVPTMTAIAEPAGGVAFVNRKWLSFTGRRLRDELGDGWLAAVHPEDRRHPAAAARQAVESRQPYSVEYRLRRADGVFRWMSHVGVPLHEECGTFVGYLGTCVDVTDTRGGVAPPDRTLEHLRLVSVNADEMIYRVRLGPPRQVEYVSTAVARILGFSPAEFIADPDAGLARVHPDDLDRLRQMRQSAPDPRQRVTLRWRHLDGRLIWAEHQRFPVYDREGNLVAVDGVIRDITREKELEQERDAQIALLDSLIAHMHDGVLAEASDGGPAVVNAAFRRMFNMDGHPAAASGRLPLSAHVRDHLADPASWPDLQREEAPAPGELRLRDGRILEQEYFTVRVEDQRIVHMWQFRDITTRKKEEEELRMSRHRLRDLSAHLEAAREEERRELARALHDEVGQLLTGIRLEVAAAVQKFQASRLPENFAVVDRLQAAVGLVDLSISTVQRLSTALRPPILDHAGLLAAIRWEAAVFERRTGIRCRVSTSPARLETQAHTTVLYRILGEALTNVARHANAGTVWIRVKQTPAALSMEVRDNGRGIRSEEAASPGGLGLLGMRERAIAAGGELHVRRLASGGTSVLVTIPTGTPAAPGAPDG